MLIYRLTKNTYANDLAGTGAKTHGGRWNNKGNAMLYCASSRSLALLEVLVHLPPLLMPNGFAMVTIDAPDDVEILDTKLLDKNWKNSPDLLLKRTGDEFLAGNKALLLKVPSFVIEEEFNYLVNPSHPSASKLKIVSIDPFSFDERLF